MVRKITDLRAAALGTKAAVVGGMQPTAEKPSQQAAGTDLRHILHEDHERLDKLFADLLAAFQADARQDAARLWNEFDAGLRTHMQLEEHDIFPEFGKVQAGEVASLRGEHERIRERLLELGVGVDLHFTRDDQVEQFICELRAHAAREDALMYQWAERELHPDAQSRIRSWLENVKKRAL